jgi:endonuclease YncB( thermonuclease family)
MEGALEMSMRALRYPVPAILLLLSLAAQPATAKRLDGVFTVVKDANVVVLDYGEGTYDIRLYGTEAPADGQPFAEEAKAFVREALLGRNAAIRFKWRNAEGEMVSRIFYRPNGDPDAAERDLAVDLVSAGLAWLRPGARYRPEITGETDKLTAALLEAQASRRGIWSVTAPVAPWTYRGKPLPEERDPSGVIQGTAGNPDINMSAISGDDNECAIAKNPNNPLQLAAHCNSLDTPWRSVDGGLTWTVGGTIGSYCCDPNLAWDSFGNLYATFINGSTNAIVTKVSVDGGANFVDLASFAGSIDQPSVVAADLTGGNVALWIVWNQSSAMVARGALVTGLGPANIGAFGPLQAIATGASCSFGDLSVSPGGAVVQVCGPQTGQTGGNVVINVDADGLGAGGFGPAIFPTTTLVGGFDFIPAQDSRSVDSETGLAFDRNPASPHFGRLFLVYTDEVVQESSDLDVMIRHSDDNGSTWSAATRVNTDATTRSQFLPKIAADPATGNMAICWHDARNSASNTAMEVWCDTTTPATYPAFVGNVLVSDGASTSNGAGVEFGDYSGLTVSAGIAHPTWADTSNSTGNNPNGTANFDAYTDQLAVLAADYTMAVTPPSQSICAPADAVYSVNVGAFGGYSDPVTLGTAGNPPGTSAGFSVNPVTPVGSSVLTIGNTQLGTPGNHLVTVSASSTTGAKGVQVTLGLFTAAAAQPVLTAPANGALNVPVPAPLSWGAAAQAGSYSVQIATDAAFTNIVEQASGLAAPAYSANAINTNTLYYWRVQATNSCGTSLYSSVFSFRTVAAPGDCASGTTASELYQYGFESGAGTWTHNGTGDSWAISTTNPHGGTSLFHANDPAIVSDQRLISPPIALPTGQNPIVLKFWHVPVLEASGATACYDGGVLEVSTNAGATWTPVPAASILAGAYTGAVSNCCSNPIAGLQAWCGTSTAYMQSIADLSAYAGQTAQLRFRLASDTSVSRDGWRVDDVVLQSCAVDALFVDGFESGDTTQWSLSFP